MEFLLSMQINCARVGDYFSHYHSAISYSGSPNLSALEKALAKCFWANFNILLHARTAKVLFRIHDPQKVCAATDKRQLCNHWTHTCLIGTEPCANVALVHYNLACEQLGSCDVARVLDILAIENKAVQQSEGRL